MQAVQPREPQIKRERESIHSGHFMVSTFEAEEQDDEDEVAVPIPEGPEVTTTTIVPVKQFSNGYSATAKISSSPQQLSIDTSLAKLFQCMSLAYRQKLTSPKWNRFRGIRLRWKDKIRLNNVIWRCWHLQFIKKENTLICQFASPLDVDTHNKPEAVVLEGKYWKRKLAAVTAEYKKWRMYHRHHSLGHACLIKDDVEMLCDVDLLTWNSQSTENMHMMVDEDYMGLMSDTLFSTITNQPFVFPDSREIAKAGLADFIQPSLGPLQPNLDDYMDTFEPLQEFMSSCKLPLPTVPEEQGHAGSWGYLELMGAAAANLQVNNIHSAPALLDQYQQSLPMPQMAVESKTMPSVVESRATMSEPTQLYQTQPIMTQQYAPPPPPSYHSSVISKNAQKPLKDIVAASTSTVAVSKMSPYGGKSVDNVYVSYSTEQQTSNVQSANMSINERIQISLQEQQRQQQQQQQQQQRMVSQPTELQQFKVPQQQSSIDQQQPPGYKFTTPAIPNLKFTSQVPHMMHPTHSAHSQYNTVHTISKEKPDGRVRGAPRGKQRSRSNTREPIRRPPLISAVSDPSLITPSNSVLLTQLLTTSTDSESVFSRSQSLLSSQERLSKQIRIKEENPCPIPILPQPPPPPTALIITTVQQSSPSDATLILNSFSNSNSPLDSSQNISSPTSSQGSIGSPNRDPLRDPRRVGHIHAEQKRRCNIKNGFDMIHSLIPHLNQNPNAKLSKAAMLQKGAEYIRQLKSERNQLAEEMECLKQQIETLNTSISNCQSLLPATGAPVTRRRDSKMQEMFNDYVRKRTIENWKYWIFSLIFRPLLESFNTYVNTSSMDDLYRTTMIWIEQHCTLVDLRPVVLNSFKYLSTATDILSEPEKLPDEARQMVLQQSNTK